MFSATARTVRDILLLVTVLVVGVATACGEVRQDERADGPEWRTGPRAGTGSATSTDPARLGAIDIDERAEFDRITLPFDGQLPAYLVDYRAAAGPHGADVLTVMLQHVQAAGEYSAAANLPAIHQVHREPSSDGSVRTTVTVNSSVRLPFRVDISPGAFYVDVAHPGVVADPS